MAATLSAAVLLAGVVLGGLTVTRGAPGCQEAGVGVCEGLVNSTALPNLLGQTRPSQVSLYLQPYLPALRQACPRLRALLCAALLPACPQGSGAPAPLPCRPLCEAARQECLDRLKAEDVPWPRDIQCPLLPTENCLMPHEDGSLGLVHRSLQAHLGGTLALQRAPPQLAPLDSELGQEEDLDVEVVSMETRGPLRRRRYDVMEMGDETLFRGWADVQGTGAANDYCRVIGRGKRRFLSCALAGSSGQEHRYVSQLGFDPGHKDTWFMRDVDDDGRDDYCRCVGRPERSQVWCMKAGEHGFYGSTFQGGSQFTFALPASEGCIGKRLNPFFGA